MKKFLLLCVVALSVIAQSAFGQDVRYNFDKETNFSKFRTYKWVELKGAGPVDDIMDKQIRQGIDAQLATKGLTKTESDPADLYLGYQAAVTQEKQFTSYSSDFGYGAGWGRGWYGGGMGSTTTTGQTSTINIGQLGIDMYDSAGKDLVWRGLVSKTLDAKAKPDKQQKNLTKALTKLFKNYPPVVKKD